MSYAARHVVAGSSGSKNYAPRISRDQILNGVTSARLDLPVDGKLTSIQRRLPGDIRKGYGRPPSRQMSRGCAARPIQYLTRA